MQSINENTYIDESLVTCVEYQLFVDELRELGEYYQPLHWHSDQFPEGQARAPVLGVRQSDVFLFCEWMTRRENGAWKYRLPSVEEAVQFPLKPLKRHPHGYWLNEPHYFAWVGPAPKDPRKIWSPINGELYHELTVFSENAYERDLIRTRSSIFVFEDKPGSNEDASEYERNRAKADQRALERAQNSASARARILNYAPGDAITRALALDFDLAVARARALNLSIAFISVHGVSRTEVLARDIRRARAVVFDHAYDADESFNHALDVFVDLYTLQERIAGRSPALEGIRLVKERQ